MKNTLTARLHLRIVESVLRTLASETAGMRGLPATDRRDLVRAISDAADKFEMARVQTQARKGPRR